jgi:hypothetical protein
MELFVVYDPKGEMFEVPHWIAKHVIIDLGWTTLPPELAAPVFPEPTPAPIPEPTPPVTPDPVPEPEPAPVPAE